MQPLCLPVHNIFFYNSERFYRYPVAYEWSEEEKGEKIIILLFAREET